MRLCLGPLIGLLAIQSISCQLTGTCEGLAPRCGAYAPDLYGDSAEYDGASVRCAVAGCGWTNGECTGFPATCSAYNKHAILCDNAGCDWSTATMQCSGFPNDCSTIISSSNCGNARGCSWTSGICSGDSKACDEHSSKAACDLTGTGRWIAATTTTTTTTTTTSTITTTTTTRRPRTPSG